MSEDVELMFNSGSVVAVKTCYNHAIEGEVIAFDYNKRVLLLKCTASDGQASHNDVRLVNLDYVSDVQIKKDVKKEESNSITTLPHLDLNKVERRARTAIDERKRLAEAFSAGITDDGIKVFLHLTKTIGNVTWDAKNIIVMNNVVISPPYKPENCMPSLPGGASDRRNIASGKNAEAVNYVRQLVERCWGDQQQKDQPQNETKTDHYSHQQSKTTTLPASTTQQTTSTASSSAQKKQLNKNGSTSSTSSDIKS
ncbi:Protein LSM12-like protein [Dinothrombium tinctorium]|uniref:Protein LSM12-like protein n=1 Tax=Dinothrombium tinctorium TaxID=1965070 RepID=A0A3S3S1T0_9ACAR|nr:Protein LSM12-like protein [Dinothrombium tinctorium]RWS09204.1 Protein LSM12-like protein [Dinothrombium tinctorium]